MVVKFRIGGPLRYLSHAETLRLFQRACVRAGINLQYSQGFNPHPRLSLPLPRPVGVESDDELLTLKVYRDAGTFFSGLIDDVRVLRLVLKDRFYNQAVMP